MYRAKVSSARVFLSLLLSVLMVWITTPVAFAAEPSVAPAKPLGALVTGGDAQVRGMAVRYETTVFEGDSIRTQGSTARLNLRGGTRVDLTLNSEGSLARIDGVPTLVLKQGVAQFASAIPFALKVGDLRLVAENAQASVMALGEGTTVTVKSGSVRAINEQTQLNAQLNAGQSVVFTKTGTPLGQVVYAADPGGGSPRPAGGSGGGHGAVVAIVASLAAAAAGIAVAVVAKRDASDANDRAAAANAAATAASTAAAQAQATAAAAAAQIATLQATVTSLQTQLTAANARITSLIASVNASSAYAAQLNAALQSLSTQMAALNAQVASLAQAQADLAQVQNDIAVCLAGGCVVSGGEAAVSAGLQALLNRLATLVTRIQTIQTTITQIAARITTILTTLPPPPPSVSP